MTSPSAPAEVVQARHIAALAAIQKLREYAYRLEIGGASKEADDLEAAARIEALNTRPVVSTLDAETVEACAKVAENVAAIVEYEALKSGPGGYRAGMMYAVKQFRRAIALRTASSLGTTDSVEACAKALVDKLDLIGGDPGGAFSNLAIHGMAYHGPTYGEELDAIKAALKTGSEFNTSPEHVNETAKSSHVGKTGSAGVGEGTP